jgi:predicted AlkP superfamily phosphohydrolase/phosphomutase
VKKKVIVIGLDGLEPAIVESLLQRNELPNLARIREAGTYARLQTTYPAQTPVAWSSFATGTNPGGHGIFDFICRDPETYLPDLAQKHVCPPPRGQQAEGRACVAAADRGRRTQRRVALPMHFSG